MAESTTKTFKKKLLFTDIANLISQTEAYTDINPGTRQLMEAYSSTSGTPRFSSSTEVEALITSHFLDIYTKEDDYLSSSYQSMNKLLLRFQEFYHNQELEPTVEKAYKNWQHKNSLQAQYEIKEYSIVPCQEHTPSLYGETQFKTIEDAIQYHINQLGTEYSWEQKSVIANGMKHGIDTSLYHDSKYTYGQMKEILYGLEAGIDVSPYLNSDLKYTEMKQIRLAITSGADLSCYMDADKKRLYVDMDGTLAKWQPVKCEEELFEEGFYRNLKPNRQVVDAIKIIIKEHPEIEVYTLSAVLTDSKYALTEKKEWLAEYIPEIEPSNQIFTHHGKDKKEFIIGGVRPNDYLLDDYTNNLILWEPPAKGIKILNGINSTKGTWKGNQLSLSKTAEMLAEDMVAIMKCDIKLRDIPPQQQQIPKEEPERTQAPAFSAQTKEKKEQFNPIKENINNVKTQGKERNNKEWEPK